MKKTSAIISGVGGYLPDYILTNEELSQMVDTSDEWIMTRIGIKERHILKGEGKGSSFMGHLAVKDLLNKTGVDPDSIELLICATVTPDMLFPSTANLIAHKAGLKKLYAYDISAACSGFLFALATAARLIESGAHKRIIVVGADKMSSIVNYEDRATCPIFGDAAAAVLVEASEDGMGVIDTELHSDGGGAAHLHLRGGGSAYPCTHETLNRKWHYIHQEGQPVFKAAVANMSDAAVDVMTRNNLTADDIRYLVPHQANMRIIDAVARRMEMPAEKCMVNISKYGNTTAATLPLCLMDYEGELKRGDNIILASFGGGYTWGSIYLKWAYDGAPRVANYTNEPLYEGL